MQIRIRNYILFLLISTAVAGIAFCLLEQGTVKFRYILDMILIEEGFLFVALRVLQISVGLLFVFVGASFMFGGIHPPHRFLPLDENENPSKIIRRGVLVGLLLSFGAILLESTISNIAFTIIKFVHRF